MADNDPGAQALNIKIGDEELKGRYSNLVRISHTREEFILDFIHFVPPQGMVTSRVIMNPSHVKRFVNALGANLAGYEQTFGPLAEGEPPGPAN